jgi:hypothetical protein
VVESELKSQTNLVTTYIIKSTYWIASCFFFFFLRRTHASNLRRNTDYITDTDWENLQSRRAEYSLPGSHDIHFGILTTASITKLAYMIVNDLMSDDHLLQWSWYIRNHAFFYHSFIPQPTCQNIKDGVNIMHIFPLCLVTLPLHTVFPIKTVCQTLGFYITQRTTLLEEY